MKSKKLLLGILSAVLVVAIVLTASIYMLYNTPERIYRAKMASAEKYLSEGDFDNAILSLKEAIRRNENDPEPYLMLSKIYVQREQKTLAVNILIQGWERTRSLQIKYALIQLGVEFDIKGEPIHLGSKPTEPLTDPTDPWYGGARVINDSLLNRFARSTYADYGNSYTIEEEMPKYNVYSITYVGLPAEFTYYNTDRDQNVLEASGRPYGNKLPTEISVKDLCLVLTNAGGGIPFERLRTMNVDNVRKSHSDEWKCDTVEFDSFDCRIIIEADPDGNIKDNTVRNKIMPFGRGGSGGRDDSPAERILQGRIINLATSEVLKNVTLRLREGINNKDGAVVFEKLCADGTYSVQLMPGDYTAEVSAAGYTTDYFAVRVNEASEITTADFGLSALLGNGEIRIVLERGAYRSDLYSHFKGYSSKGRFFELSYLIQFYGLRAEEDGKLLAELNVDDASGFETTTVYDIGGRYEFHVHTPDISWLSAAGVVVKVFTADRAEPIVIEVPTQMDYVWWTGSYWIVFNLENGQLTNIKGR